MRSNPDNRLNTRYRRIKREILDDLTRIVLGRLRSTFYENARKEWALADGRKTNNVRNEYSSFYLELPG